MRRVIAVSGLLGLACAGAPKTTTQVGVAGAPRSSSPQAAEAKAAGPAPVLSKVARPVEVEEAAPPRDESNPSCVGAAVSCQGASCCERLSVPGGETTLRADSGRSQQVSVAGFALDRFEVTVGRVRAWVDAEQPLPAPGTHVSGYQWTGGEPIQRGQGLSGWRRYDTFTGSDARRPKNSINWYTAAAFCAWDGGRLPTGVEFKYAARGGDEQRAYPWGNEAPTPVRAIYNCTGDGARGCSLDDIPPVGSRPQGRGRWGHDDLVGSLFEWTADSWLKGTQASRGGGFCFIGGVDHRAPSTAVRPEEIRHDAPTTVSHTVGFRCAYDEAAESSNPP